MTTSYKVENLPPGPAGMAWIADQVRMTRPELELLPRVTAAFRVYSKIRSCVLGDGTKKKDKDLIALLKKCDEKVRDLRDQWEPAENHQEAAFEVVNEYLIDLDEFEKDVDVLIVQSKLFEKVQIEPFTVPDRVRRKQDAARAGPD